MTKKNTDDLQTELHNTRDLSQFLEENQISFHDMDFAGKLEEMIAKSGFTKASLAERSGMSEVYLYQVLSGKRNPTRTRIICLCIGLAALAPLDAIRHKRAAPCAFLYQHINISLHALLI